MDATKISLLFHVAQRKMNLTDYINYLKRLSTILPANRKKEGLRIANEVAQKVQVRIQSSGRSHTGAPFPGYSPEYKKEKSEKGLQVRYFDFTDTGFAWQNIGAEFVKDEQGQAVIEIKAKNADAERKLQGQLKKRGNILRINADEKRFFREENRKRIINLFR